MGSGRLSVIVAEQAAEPITTMDAPHDEAERRETRPPVHGTTCMKRTGTRSASHTFSFPS
jgi:hypothetical protein